MDPFRSIEKSSLQLPPSQPLIQRFSRASLVAFLIGCQFFRFSSTPGVNLLASNSHRCSSMFWPIVMPSMRSTSSWQGSFQMWPLSSLLSLRNPDWTGCRPIQRYSPHVERTTSHETLCHLECPKSRGQQACDSHHSHPFLLLLLLSGRVACHGVIAWTCIVRKGTYRQ